MLKRVLNVGLLVAGTMATYSFVHGQTAFEKINPVTEKLMQLQKTEDLAEDNKDIVALDRFLTEGFIFTGPNGSISEKKKFMDGVRSDDAVPGHTVRYDDVKSYFYGRTVVINFSLIENGRDKTGKEYTSRFRKTVVWVKQREEWQMAALHVSRVRT